MEISSALYCKPAIFFLICVIISVCIQLIQQISTGNYPNIAQTICTCCCICLSFIFVSGLCVYNMMIAWGVAIVACMLTTSGISLTINSMINKN